MEHMKITEVEAIQLLIDSAKLTTDVRDKQLNEKSIDSLVAASIGPYAAFYADGSEYTGWYGAKVPEKQIADYHRPSFELWCDKTDVDLIAFETIPCSQEVYAFLSLLPSRPGARAFITIACNSVSTLCNGDSVAECVRQIEKRDTAHQVEAIGVNCTPPEFISDLIQIIRAETNRIIIVYPNSGETWDNDNDAWDEGKGKAGP